LSVVGVSSVVEASPVEPLLPLSVSVSLVAVESPQAPSSRAVSGTVRRERTDLRWDVDDMGARSQYRTPAAADASPNPTMKAARGAVGRRCDGRFAVGGRAPRAHGPERCPQGQAAAGDAGGASKGTAGGEARRPCAKLVACPPSAIRKHR